MKKLSFAALFFAAAGQVHAAGFATDTHGARATGQGTAVVAHLDDASAAFYNPAGVGKRKGLDVQLGDTLIMPSVQYENSAGTVTKTNPTIVPPPHLYAGYGVTDQLGFGLGLFSPFGSSGNWPEDWEGRQRIVRSSLATYFINPEAMYRLHPRLSFGAGVQIVRGTILLERGLNFVDSTGTVTLGGATWGLGWNIGVQAELAEKTLYFGGTWRSGVPLKFNGRAHFEGVPNELRGTLKDQPVSAEVTLPTVAALGLTYMPIERLTVSFDANWYTWADFPRLRIEFEDPALTSTQPKRWSDTWNYHLGAEYGITEQITARAGFVYDPTPGPEDTLTPDLPDVTRTKIALGGGYRMGSFGVDLGYQLVLLNETTSTAPQFPGKYSGTAHVIGLTLGYRM